MAATSGTERHRGLAGAQPLESQDVVEIRCFPSLLQPRRRAEQVLLTVVQEAYVHGVSTRKTDELVVRLRPSGYRGRLRLSAGVQAEARRGGEQGRR